MNRDYPPWVLGRYGKNGAKETARSRTGRKQQPEGKREGRPPAYMTVPFVMVLRGIRDFYDYPCGKLLVPQARGTIEYLAGSEKINFGIANEIRRLLVRASPVETGILPQGERKKLEFRGKA
jgi:hypothetical protein